MRMSRDQRRVRKKAHGGIWRLEMKSGIEINYSQAHEKEGKGAAAIERNPY